MANVHQVSRDRNHRFVEWSTAKSFSDPGVMLRPQNLVDMMRPIVAQVVCHGLAPSKDLKTDEQWHQPRMGGVNCDSDLICLPSNCHALFVRYLPP